MMLKERIGKILHLARMAKRDGVHELSIDTVIRALETLKKESDGFPVVHCFVPLRLEAYVKLARWVSSIVAIPQPQLKAMDVTKLGGVLRTQQTCGSIRDYAVSSEDIKVAVYHTAEYMHCDVVTGTWTVRDLFKEVASLNEFLPEVEETKQLDEPPCPNCQKDGYGLFCGELPCKCDCHKPLCEGGSKR